MLLFQWDLATNIGPVFPNFSNPPCIEVQEIFLSAKHFKCEVKEWVLIDSQVIDQMQNLLV